MRHLLQGTPVPKVVTALFFVWAFGFVGVVYLIVQTEGQADAFTARNHINYLAE